MTARDFSKIPDNVTLLGVKSDGKKDCIHIGVNEVIIDSSYTPEENDGDDYMNQKHLAYFKKVLMVWRHSLSEKSAETVTHMHEGSTDRGSSEEGDLASEEERIMTELRTRDRYRKLSYKIDQAIMRIETGSYGYCEISGEEIGIKRLMVKPTANLCKAQQEIHEANENIIEDAERNHIINSEDDPQ